MNADDVLSAKAEVFTKAFGYEAIAGAYAVGAEPLFAPPPGSAIAEVVARGRREGRPDARDLIAIGSLTPGHNGGPYEAALGIFVQQQRLRQHPIVEAAIRAARGNVRVIYTGPVRRFGGGGMPRCRPLQAGVSVSHHRVTAGTLGCFVRQRNGGGIGILSNNHVLADTNRAILGDTILQPGKVDGGRIADAADHVAQLTQFVRIDFSPGAINLVDAAYALLLYRMQIVSDHIGDIGPGGATGWPIGLTESLIVPGESVKKCGRTTGVTRGTVVADRVDNVLVNFIFGQVGGVARFDGQFSIEGTAGRFSAPGDSGSLIFNDQNNAVGLLFAGTERGGQHGRGLTYATPIEIVLDKLDIDICTGT